MTCWASELTEYLRDQREFTDWLYGESISHNVWDEMGLDAEAELVRTAQSDSPVPVLIFVALTSDNWSVRIAALNVVRERYGAANSSAVMQEVWAAEDHAEASGGDPISGPHRRIP